jgi:hypothetical protein
MPPDYEQSNTTPSEVISINLYPPKYTDLFPTM